MLIKNHLQILEKIYKRKKGITDAYKIDEIDVDSYTFFTIFWTFSQNPTEKSDLVNDLSMQPSLLKNLNMRSLLRKSLSIYPENCM